MYCGVVSGSAVVKADPARKLGLGGARIGLITNLGFCCGCSCVLILITWGLLCDALHVQGDSSFCMW